LAAAAKAVEAPAPETATAEAIETATPEAVGAATIEPPVETIIAGVPCGPAGPEWYVWGFGGHNVPKPLAEDEAGDQEDDSPN
jgi:hypothetical protein